MFETSLQILSILLFLIFCIYLLAQKRWEIAVFALVGGLLSCVSLGFFDLQAFFYPENLSALKKASLISESLLPFLFLLFSLTFGRAGALRGMSWISLFLLAGALAVPIFVAATPVQRFFYSPDFSEEQVLFLRNHGFYFYLCLMFYMVAALFNLERTYVALSRAERWKVKFEVLGIGAILTILLVYFSQAILYRSIDMNLVPVRSLVFSIGIGLVWYSRLRRGTAVNIRVSKDMAYRSLVVLAVGIYLVGLGLLGEGMRYLGFPLDRPIMILVAVLSGMLVVFLLLSEQLRRKAKVFLHKNFYRTKFDYRKEWLRFTRHLSSARSIEELQRGILSFFCETFATKGAALYLHDEDSGHFKAVAVHETDALEKTFESDSPFVRHLGIREWVFNVADDNTEELEGVLEFCRDQGFHLAVPLLFENDLEGFIFLGRAINTGEKLFYEDYDLMKVLAHQATSSLLSLKLSNQLSLAQEMAAIGRVSAFVMHDLKNLVSSLALVVDNARNYLDDPEFQSDMLETLDNTVKKMNGLIARLKNMEGKNALSLSPGDLLQTVRESVKAGGDEDVEVAGEPVRAVMDEEEIQKVLLNLLLNAREASRGNGPVRVEVGRDDMAYVRVSDQGSGMSEEFIRTRLFRPFQTTKKKGFGIGLYQCRQVIEAHGGRIEVESREGKGTMFTVRLPLTADH